MDLNLQKTLGSGALLVCCLLSGFWLSHSGKPLNGLIFTIHKLIALAAVILLAVTVYQANQATPLSASLWLACAVTGLFLIGLFVSGALLSTGKPVPAVLLNIHRLMPILTLLSATGILYLLRRA